MSIVYRMVPAKRTGAAKGRESFRPCWVAVGASPCIPKRLQENDARQLTRQTLLLNLTNDQTVY